MTNPVLIPKRFSDITPRDESDVITRSGVLGALGFLLVLFMAATCISWWHFSTLLPLATSPMSIPPTANRELLVLVLVAFVVGIIATRTPKLSRYLGPVYAVLEGAVVGAVSYVYNATYPGIVLEAVGSTLGVFFVMYFLYATGLVKVTNRVRAVITYAVLGAVVFYAVTLLLGLFTSVNILAVGGPLGIGISLVTSTIASFNLLLNFDFVESLVERGAANSVCPIQATPDPLHHTRYS
jgi:uncharacterized YccA/Bax inhibitor family protein